MNLRYYTGIGSRKTPEDILILMGRCAKRLAEDGWWLRSGGAGGADAAFGSIESPNKEIFLPWRGFAPQGYSSYDPALWAQAESIAADPRVYPDFLRIKEQIQSLEAKGLSATSSGKSINSLKATLKLQTRNVFQVLGSDLQTPSSFVICWTPDGAISADQYRRGVTGGTGTAINLASVRGIEVFNLKRADHRARIEEFVGKVEPSPNTTMEMNV